MESMTHKELSYDDLAITPSDVYEQMGYHEQWPDEATCRETESILQEVRALLRPRLCFTVVYGTLDMEQNQLTIQDTTFDIGKIIARQLRGSEAFALFVATSGTEFEQYQQQLKTKGDMVRIFITNSIGSIIAEKAADAMEEALQAFIDKTGWKHTNRFSPGYCGWHVSEQQRLFSLFPTEEHTSWQWFPMVKAARPFILDNTPAQYRPVVQVIDNVERNHKLGLIFEFSVGKGKLLVCMSPLHQLQEYPEARQLCASIMAYMGSADFNPATHITSDELRLLLTTPVEEGKMKQLFNITQY